ncbi:hypothetical protein AQUCO_04700117v1 [Aquilegia coerulea]|uniref:F-box domain-containing protein n=1 Tax=Aquilegia coerulea TaxID=218851 RepID=A0A2G5CL59_AQUCA|nr:hypothetical protein AQUCO_04700117v1 [Aquilegia coerulea]
MKASGQQIEGFDYLSDLPDGVLHHVLSFLPIKDVIRTSFISRRWRYLWTSVPTLDFNGLVFSPKPKFINFVDSVLHRRDNCGIQKFCLRFGGYYCTSTHAHAWILAAINHNVQELGLSFYALNSFELPREIFTCRSLTVLTLKLNYSTFYLPSFIYLPFLKTLQLIQVTFSDDILSHFFYNCPMLEDVLIEDFLLKDLTVLHISSTSLQTLNIDGIQKDLMFYNCMLESEIRILTPNLLSLEYKDSFKRNISLGNMSSLTNASIDLDFDMDDSEQTCGCQAINLLKDLASAKCLMLSSAIVKILSATPTVFLQLQTFSNLKRLKLTVDVSGQNIRAMACFLHLSPCLELLTIELSRSRRWFNTNDVFEPQEAEYVVDHLKIVKIRGFLGSEQECGFVKYLLEHACTLERMTIVSSKQLSANSALRMKIREEILLHPRCSRNSEIIF